MKKIFEGVCVALITPFAKGKVDFESIERLIEQQIKNGASAICVLGTTGESSTVTEKEREQIIKFSKKIIADRCKLIVGTGSNNFELAYKYTKMAKRLGADGVLVVTPYYNKTTQSGIINYYEKLSQIGIAMIVYNVPSRTGLNVELKTIKTLLKNEYIYGIKESTADINRIIDLCNLCKNKIAVYSGEDKLNYLFYTLGGNGCVSVTANAFCKSVNNVYVQVKSQKIKKALNEQTKLNNINEILFCETNPVPVKYLLAKMGYITNELRLPLIPLSCKNQKRVDKEMVNFIKKCDS